MSGDPWESFATKRGLVPWIPPELKVIGTIPAPAPMTACYDDGETVEAGTVVAFLVLEGPDGYSTVVGVVADDEGLHVCEEAVNFTGYTGATFGDGAREEVG